MPHSGAHDVETLGGLLRESAAASGRKPVVQFIDGPSITAEDLLQLSSQAGGVFQQLGVHRGDRVAIMLSNSEEFLWAYFGAAICGAVSVPLNVELRGPILEHMLAESEPTVIVAETQYVPTLEVALSTTGVETTILRAGSSGGGTDEFRSAVLGSDPGGFVETAPADLAVILYTSGTTGRSKGIMVCNRMSMSLPAAVEQSLEYRADDVMYNVLPLFHGNTLNISLLPALRTGATAVIGRRFSASNWWKEITECGATAISLLGSMVPILWNRPPTEFDRAHNVRIALAVPAPMTEYEGFEQRFGLRLASLYGMTDCGLTILTPPGQGRPGYAGTAHDDWECRVVDEFDEPVPDGYGGELVLRPKRPFITQLGYWRNAEATVTAWQNLWFHTGDRMIRDPDGWFRFVDRKKDAIRRFGENISSFEVESVILSHPAVAEVAVFPVPSEMEEDEVMAAVVLEEGSSCTAAQLSEHCTHLLPYFAVPRFIDIRGHLPKTSTEKVRKEVLRAEGVTSSTWDLGPTGRRARSGRSAATPPP